MAKLHNIRTDIRKNGTYRARATVTLEDGSKKRIEAYGKTARLAAQNLRIKNGEKVEPIPEKKEKEKEQTLADAVQLKIQERRNECDRMTGKKVRRDTTVDRDEQCVDSLLLPYSIANKPIAKLTAIDLARYRKQLETAKHDRKRTCHRHKPDMVLYSASTLNRVIRLVADAVDDCFRFLPQKSPSDALPQFPQRKRKKTAKDILTTAEVKRFISLCDQKRKEQKNPLDAVHADLFAFSIYMGMRPGENLGLQMRDYDPVGKTITVQRTGSYEDGRVKTSYSIDTLYLIEQAAEILDRRYDERTPTALFFANGKGQILSPTNNNRKLKHWLAELGIDKDLHSHSLRGSCASLIYNNGGKTEDVRSLLRHASAQTTMDWYIVETDERKIMASKVAQAAFSALN